MDDLFAEHGLDDERSSTGSRTQLKSPPSTRECEFKSGIRERECLKKLTSSKLGA